MWALNLAMRATLVWWWENHKGAFQDWDECHGMMILQFEPPVNLPMEIFLGHGDPGKHLSVWMELWYKRTWEKWVHMFIHALGPIPTTWYLDAELHQRTRHWDTMREDFLGTFGVICGIEKLDEDLQDIYALLFNASLA